jgi:hypothetical protein
VADDGVICAFYDGWERTESRGRRLVSIREKSRSSSTDIVVCRWRMYYFLYIGAVEIVVRTST